MFPSKSKAKHPTETIGTATRHILQIKNTARGCCHNNHGRTFRYPAASEKQVRIQAPTNGAQNPPHERGSNRPSALPTKHRPWLLP